MAIERSGARGAGRRSPAMVEKLEIDFLILADHTEVVTGKLYMMGGCWDRKAVENFEAPVGFGVAAGILVPWNMTNQEHQFTLGVENADGEPLAPPVSGGFNVGRPIQSIPGQVFRATLGAQVGIVIPALGTYRVRLSLGEGITKAVAFHAVSSL